MILLNACTDKSNKTHTIVPKKEVIKKINKPDLTETKKAPKAKKKQQTTHSNSKLLTDKVHVVNVPIQRGVYFNVEQDSILFARPKGTDPRVILKHTENNTIQSHPMTNSLKINTSSFTPGSYDVYIVKQNTNNALSLFLIKAGETPVLNNTLISQPLWFIQVMHNKHIRYFQDMGDGLCIYPIYPEYIFNMINTNEKIFPSSTKQTIIKFNQLAPRSAQYVSFFISSLAEPNLPNNSFIDFFYSTRRIPLTPIKRMWLISGLSNKQRYNLTIQIPTVKNYDPNKYLSYKTASNLKNKFKFVIFVKGWKIQL